ncbi:MAG: queuosine precursor transporter [Bacillota bacterium]
MEKRTYKYFDIILGLFVAVIMISNIVSTKIVVIGWKPFQLTFDGGTIIFPLSYIFGDILTEVYGYERSRRVIWTGFAGLVLMSIVIYLVGIMKPASFWDQQKAYESILMYTPRIVLGSMVAYFAGEFSNSYILSRMKILTKGKRLWMRTIGSTLAGELIDTVVFVLVAFAGTFAAVEVLGLIVANYIFKTGVEIFFTPATYRIVGWLKREEAEDHYDYGVDYNPFLIR